MIIDAIRPVLVDRRDPGCGQRVDRGRELVERDRALVHPPAPTAHDPLLLALRRLAQEDASARRWGFETGEPGAHTSGDPG